MIKSGTFSNTFVHHGLHAQLSLLQLLILVWGDRVSFYRLSAVKLQVVSKRQIRDSSQTFSAFFIKKECQIVKPYRPQQNSSKHHHFNEECLVI